MQDNGSSTRLQLDFQHIDALVAVNTRQTVEAFRKCGPDKDSEGHEATLNHAVARIMGTDAAIATMQLLSGIRAAKHMRMDWIERPEK